MGGGVSALQVNDDKKHPGYGIGFSKAMFSHSEWNTLKTFCNEHNIWQIDLNRLFKQYLSSEEALLRRMKVAPQDFKNKFVDHSMIVKECADVFIPQIFLKEYSGLDPAYSTDEISFSRFVILGYILAAQPIQDLVFDFFAICKRNFNLRLIASMYTYNVYQVVRVLSEDIKMTAALRYVLRMCNVRNDTEIPIEHVMQMAVKYPIMFFQLHIFRVAYRRKFFGDVFWHDRPLLSSRFFDLPCKEDVYKNIDAAQLQTARAIVLDYLDGTPPSLIPSEVPNVGNLDEFEVTDKMFTRMKNTLGYRETRALVKETGFKWSEEQFFMDINEEVPEEQRLLDSKLKTEFMYSAATGFRSWIESYRARDGSLLKEMCFRPDGKHMEGRTEEELSESSVADSSMYYYSESRSGGGSSVISGTKSRTRTTTKKSAAGASLTNNSLASGRQSPTRTAASASIKSGK
eukprot:CAMPEP_0185023664 /NCGR_PEP_ID=MMETSP1103-20130426/6312_1 /TAXON_ID=36769 /ORGANISM="Paraphysomonas bandaiensis, Strain Caron Lab Isolate" /LENGTH=458 /DNA_ID=CAMNT_0027556355 /DNA_START=80 /DNA_END=1453 /DNA_ORIENTATION=-